MLILGIDPGTTVTGYGLLKCDKQSIEAIDYGCIRPPQKEHLHQRYLIIYESIEHLIEKYQPDALSIETQFIQKNIQGAIKLGMARGVSIVAAAKKSIPIFEYAPAKAKKSLVGNGRASKQQVQYMVQKLLRITQKDIPEDAADALCLAYCHYHNSKSLLSPS